MEHIIAYNPYKNGNKGSVSSQPLSVYDKTIAYPWMADLVAAIRGGNDELKKQLPFRCAHYYQFRDNRRSQKNAVPESFLFQTTIDVDDKEYVDKAIEKARELNCSDTIWNGALLHLEYSARKKLHIDIRMPIGMTIEETQRAYCEALGVPYDESCITPERMLFITDKASEIYRSPHWYEVLPQEELKKRRQAYLDRGLSWSLSGCCRSGNRQEPSSLRPLPQCGRSEGRRHQHPRLPPLIAPGDYERRRIESDARRGTEGGGGAEDACLLAGA